MSVSVTAGVSLESSSTCYVFKKQCAVIVGLGGGERRAGEATVITFISRPQDGVAIRARNHDWLLPPS